MSNHLIRTHEEQLGEIIRKARMKAELTQGQLATQMGAHLQTTLHKSAVSKIEAGSRPVSLHEAKVLCDILSIPIEQLASAWEPQDLFSQWERVRRGALHAATCLMEARATVAKPISEARQIVESAEKIDPDTTDSDTLEWFIRDMREASENLEAFEEEASTWEYTLFELSEGRSEDRARIKEWSLEISDTPGSTDASA